jgi:hypothetical protein
MSTSSISRQTKHRRHTFMEWLLRASRVKYSRNRCATLLQWYVILWIKCIAFSFSLTKAAHLLHTPPHNRSPHMPPQAQSRWRITIAAPPKHVEDVELQHRSHGEDDGIESPNVKRRRAQCTLLVDFCPSSSVSACGTQVWAAALLLADYLVHIGPSLEVGCSFSPPLPPL